MQVDVVDVGQLGICHGLADPGEEHREGDSTQQGQSLQDRQQSDPNAIGRAFDDSKIDDSFYLPPEVFDNRDFKRGLKQFVSPDGKAVRFTISHQGDLATPAGISHVDEIKNAAFASTRSRLRSRSPTSPRTSKMTRRLWPRPSTG